MAAETILSLLTERARVSPTAPASFRRGSGGWSPLSLLELLQMSKRFGSSLSGIGFRSGDRLAVLCRTRLEWMVADLGAMFARVVTVGIDAHASNAQISQILEEVSPAGLLVDSSAQLAQIPPTLLARVRIIVAIDDRAVKGEDVDGVTSWSRFIGSEGSAPSVAALAESAKPFDVPETDGADPATLLYTSGTTGRPRAILYRQRQLTVACTAIVDEFPSLVAASGGSTICWLPMAALFQRMMNYVALSTGVAIYFVEDPATVVDIAKEVQPTYFIGVPRFFEKLYQGIQRKLARNPKWLRRRVTDLLARTPGSNGRNVRWLDRLILSKLRRVLGGRLRFVITGSAPAPAWLLNYFNGLGILILEAYGVSESTVPIAANRPSSYRNGSVGKVFGVNEVKIAEDGEILVRGPGMFDGYWTGSDGPTSPAPPTADGFFRTGDLGRFDSDGFLFIDGRKSEVFKTSTGRRIAPSKLEAIYKQIQYIDQIVVVGHGRPYPSALLTINVPLLKSALGRHRDLWKDTALSPDHILTPEMRKQISNDMEAVDSGLASYERIRRFGILERPLSLEEGELTSSLKLRRAAIERKYDSIIDKIYALSA